MAYTDNFPQRPVFMADFANGGRIDPRATFSRSDSPIDASKAAASAVHYWSNEKHLSSENLIVYSNDVGQANWVKDGVTETGGQTAPDGGTDAYKLAENTANDEHRIYQAASEVITSSGSLTVSAYLKYIGRQWVRVRLTDSGGTNRHVWFDIQNGTKGTEESGMTGTIDDSGSGYYKITATISNTVASGTYVVIGGASGDGNIAYTGSGSDAFAIWGIQGSTTGETVLNETSGQIHREYAPTLKSVATAGAARFEYDPTDGQSMGCLIEGQSQNLLPSGATGYNSSNVFNWNATNVNLSQNAAVAPTGSLEATHIYENSATTTQHRFDTVVTATAAAHTFSGYFKTAGRDDIVVRVANDGNVYGAQFTFSTQTAANYGTAFSSLSISSVGNGWYRFVATTPTLASGSTNIFINLFNGALNYTGDDYGGVLFYGLQFETGAASSLIATVDSAATRAADSMSVPIASTGYTGGPVTLLAESTTETDTTNPVTVMLYANGDHQIVMYGNSTNKRAAYVEADNTASTLTSTADANGVRALRVDTNDISTALNGTIDATDTSQTLPDLTGATVYIGDDSNGGNSIDGHIKRVAIYNEALSDTNLQALTS